MIRLRANNFDLKDIELVLFDKDGTIFDIHKYWSFVITRRAEYFSNLAEPLHRRRLFDELNMVMGLMDNNLISNSGPVGIKSRRDIIELVCSTLQKTISEVTIEDVEIGFSKIDSMANDSFDSTLKTLPGVKKVMEELRNEKCLVSLATTDVESRSIQTLKYADLYQYFDCMVCSDHVKNSKPSRDIVDKTMKELNCQNRNGVALIGDSMVDLEMAKNSGIHFIGVGTGLNSNEFITQSDNYVEFLTELEILPHKTNL